MLAAARENLQRMEAFSTELCLACDGICLIKRLISPHKIGFLIENYDKKLINVEPVRGWFMMKVLIC